MCDFYLARCCGPVVNPAAQHWWRMVRRSVESASILQPLRLLITEPVTNFACNSPVTISNLEFASLELQRFQTLLNLHLIELHATFGGERQAALPAVPSTLVVCSAC